MRDVKSIGPTGRVQLEGGEEMQLVVSNQGQLGVRQVTEQDHMKGIDQPLDDGRPEAISPAEQARILRELTGE